MDSRLYVEYDCHWADFDNTEIYSKTFCKEVLCGVSWKSEKGPEKKRSHANGR